MPRTGGLLDDAERSAFGRWLRQRVEQSGIRKTELAANLGDSSTTNRLNRYLDETRVVIPLPHVLGKLAHAIGVPWPVAFLRAGYFRELLGIINLLGFVAKEQDQGELEARQQLREMVIEFALNAFPRRDVRRVAPFAEDELNYDPIVLFVGSDLPPDSKDQVAALTSRLHPLLSRAATALEDTRVAPVVRRAVASEYVNAWADEYDLALANAHRGMQKHVSHILEGAL